MTTAPGRRFPRISFGKHEKRSETAARMIVRDIVDRDLPPGAMLPSEGVMLQQLGVGRPTLREALRILEINGLIALKPGMGGGPIVADPTASDFGRVATLHFEIRKLTFGELLGAMATLEPVMARLAASSADVEGKERLLQFAVADEHRTGDHGQFHPAMLQLAGNRLLGLVVQALHTVTDLRVSDAFSPEQLHSIEKDHLAIARAIIEGKAARAERLMAEHYERIQEYVQALGLYDEVVQWE